MSHLSNPLAMMLSVFLKIKKPLPLDCSGILPQRPSAHMYTHNKYNTIQRKR